MDWTERLRDSDAALDIPMSWQHAVGGYLAVGDPAVPWSASDWARFPRRRKPPIIEVSDMTAWQPGTLARSVRDELESLNVPLRSYTALAIETQVDPAWVESYGDHMHRFGFKTWVCGSASTVFGNPQLNGYWVEDWVTTGPYMYNHSGVRVTQYADPDHGSGGHWDSSTVEDWVYYSNNWWR